jgi:hypothetical protein
MAVIYISVIYARGNMARIAVPASKAEKIILIVMGVILAVSLVVLYKKDSSKPSKRDTNKTTLPVEAENE